MDFLIKYIKNSLDNIVFLSLFLGVLSYWISVVFPTFKFVNKLGFINLLISNLFITVILGWRWVESGYFPLSNLYESLLFFTWGITFLTLLVELVTSLLLVGAVTSPLAMFIVGFATLSLPDGMQKAAPLVPALKSNWLMMHVSIMMFSYSTLIIGSLLSIVFLVLTQGKQVSLQGSSIGVINSQTFDIENKNSLDNLKPNTIRKEGILEKKLSLLESLDNLSYRIIGLGFPLLTIGIIAGAVWANEAWGSYWSWDPKETWALITWLVFAAYLHARITRSWQGKGPAVLASIGFIVVWVCYLGVNFLGKGLHSYGWIA
jgi:cytochrome c-type biogenesis protein CcsB|uniref:cytochrome c biogenesis protein n=1 Tax=Cryptomonas pyrenoidifera TaxID=233184 RepID=UPI0022A70F42|nr:cytochrome c biogenesis protein [Cryptomonas pyrenoidifera]UZS90568.1 cytochrome c biogenesis protein [Cryptomonas pyrenoidifera]